MATDRKVKDQRRAACFEMGCPVVGVWVGGRWGGWLCLSSGFSRVRSGYFPCQFWFFLCEFRFLAWGIHLHKHAHTYIYKFKQKRISKTSFQTLAMEWAKDPANADDMNCLNRA